jgi:hypothetical protein
MELKEDNPIDWKLSDPKDMQQSTADSQKNVAESPNKGALIVAVPAVVAVCDTYADRQHTWQSRIMLDRAQQIMPRRPDVQVMA